MQLNSTRDTCAEYISFSIVCSTLNTTTGVGNVIIWFVHTFLPVTWEIWSAKSEEHWKMRHKVSITASYKVTLFIRKSFERYQDFNLVKDYVQWTISGCCHLAIFGLHARVHQYLTGGFCLTPTRSSPWIPLRKIFDGRYPSLVKGS